jgi:peptidyl-prolyl cis-trans isomerase C
MKIRHRTPVVTTTLACVSLLLLVACKDTKSPAGADDKPVATVDGRKISRNTFNFYAEGVSRQKFDTLTPEKRAELLDSLIRGELIAEEAEKNGLAAQAETRAMLDLSRLDILQQASQAAYIKAHPVTDVELKAEYDSQVAAMQKTEYHARHILVATEDFARRLIDKLEHGGNFNELARKESMDTSKSNDGDLGWFTPERMVAPFAAAVRTLKVGEYTHAPVKTDFGWHVIKLEETREAAPPGFDTVKDRLGQVVEAKKFRVHTDELLKAAKLEKTL